jgi:hypothetical protein
MSNDALERLKNRHRPVVKSRDTSLVKSLDVSSSRSLDTSTSKHQDISLKTKQTTLRLEEKISQELSELCQENGFCREVFIEALIEYYQNHSQELEEVITEARKKADLRMEIANQKRAKSMMKRFNPSE